MAGIKAPKVKTPSQMKMEMAVDRARGVMPKAERDANLGKMLEGSAIKDRMYHASPHYYDDDMGYVKTAPDEGISSFKLPDDLNKMGSYSDPTANALFMTPSYEFANKFSGTITPDPLARPAIYPMYVQAKNPFDYENPKHIENLRSYLIEHRPNDIDDDAIVEYIKHLGNPKTESNWTSIENPEIQESIKELGHDSFYAKEKGVKNLGVYNPNAVKSAIGNEGTYDTSNPDITKAEGGAVKPPAVFEQAQVPFEEVRRQLGMKSGGAVHMAGGGAGRKLANRMLPKVEAPSIMTRSGISELAEYIKNREGSYGERRVQRAADEIPRLGEMYTQDALRSAFSGDNARALMTMNPADFEKFARPLELNPTTKVGGNKDKHDMSTEDYVKYLQGVGGFDQVPYLLVNKGVAGEVQLPWITGHEGRHRSRSLADSGITSSLVEFQPRAELREPFPRRSQAEYIDAIRKEMALTDNKVKPEQYWDDVAQQEIRRKMVQLPDLYAQGGAVHMKDGGDPDEIVDQAVMDQIRLELANQPTLKPTTDVNEQIANARRMADPARLSLDAGDAITSPEMYEQNKDLFSLNRKPSSQAYTEFGVPMVDAAGKSVPFPKTMHDIEIDKVEKQLEAGIKPSWMSGKDFIEDQAARKGYVTSPKTAGDFGQNAMAALMGSTFLGGTLKALGAADEAAQAVIGSSYGLDPTMGIIGQTGRLHRVPRGLSTIKEGIARDVGQFPNDFFNAQRGVTQGYPTLGSVTGDVVGKVAPIVSKIDDAVRLGYESGRIPQIGMSIKDVTPRVLAPANPQGFYSPTEAAALNLPRKSGSGQAFLNDLLKQENVRPDEINAMGLDEWLKGKKDVTAAEVQDYIAKNKIQLGEAVYQDKPSINKFAMQRGMSEDDANNVVTLARQGNPDAKKIVDEYANTNITKFQQYQLPGGENYREIVLTLPVKPLEGATLSKTDSGYWRVTYKDGDTAMFRTEREARDGMGGYNNYQSSHWDEANPLAHLRMSDRVTDGKKTLLVDEVQSDWHQAGREQGYKNDIDMPAMSADELLLDYGDKLSSGQKDYLKDFLSRWERAEQGTNENIRGQRLDNLSTEYESWAKRQKIAGVPDAPFKDDWYQLALKRAIKEAIDGGYDRVALPTGARVAERFDLSKQIDRIDYNKNDDGTYSMSAIKGGKEVFSKERLDENELSGLVGKDVAKKIVGDEGKAQYDADIADELGVGVVKSLTGLDLQVGGKGMKKYYDEIYPGYLKKFGKKYGANVGMTSVQTEPSTDRIFKDVGKYYAYTGQGRDTKEFNTYAEALKFLGIGSEPLHYMEITPAMREAFKEGIHMKRGGKVQFANNIDAMRLALSKG